MILLMLAQTAAAAPPPVSSAEAVAPIDFDLRTVEPATDEIVVRGRRRDDQRMPPLTAFAEEPEGLPRAETGLIGNIRAGVTAEQVQLPGATSQRVMLKLKMPF